MCPNALGSTPRRRWDTDPMAHPDSEQRLDTAPLAGDSVGLFRRADVDPGHSPLPRRSSAQRGTAGHAVRGDPGAQRIEPPALSVPRPHRRPQGPARQGIDRRERPLVLGRQGGRRGLLGKFGQGRVQPEITDGKIDVGVRRPLRVGTGPDPAVLPALSRRPRRRRGVDLPGLPEPAARSAARWATAGS